LNIIRHLNRFAKGSHEVKARNRKDGVVKDIKKENEGLYHEVIRILEFYVYGNEMNRKKILIVMGTALSMSL
jgi:hypothetical protein